MTVQRAWMSGTASGYTKVIAWQKAYELVLEVYSATANFPSDERFGLVQQARRAAVSLPSLIAEGWGRGSTSDYLRFLDMARGSAQELQTQLWIAVDLGYLQRNHPLLELIEEVLRITNGLIKSLRK